MDSIDRLRPAYDSFSAIAVTYGIDILLALLILAVGWWISNAVANTLRRTLARTNVDATLTRCSPASRCGRSASSRSSPRSASSALPPPAS